MLESSALKINLIKSIRMIALVIVLKRNGLKSYSIVRDMMCEKQYTNNLVNFFPDLRL